MNSSNTEPRPKHQAGPSWTSDGHHQRLGSTWHGQTVLEFHSQDTWSHQGRGPLPSAWLCREEAAYDYEGKEAV